MFQVVLFRPEIPPNTGSVMRLCANVGTPLHLIEPLGFDLDDAKLRRAGMDYRDRAVVQVHSDLEQWRTSTQPGRIYALAGEAELGYTEVDFREDDAFLFGPESVGLTPATLDSAWITERLRIPMQPGVRSLNLSNAVSVVLYEAWRQFGFVGAIQPAPAPRQDG
ncbi:MAG TPA: tRNA (cytidine(34)-2'-O)-methyltransferase [Acidimicrobiia bacterium]|jgi:tRNA (cytidine/uridine-2'-O-)-methyltransferase